MHRKKHGTRHKRPVEWLDEGSDKQNVNRQSRRTAHERRHENRRETSLGIAERAGGHHARNRAGVAREKRHEAASIEPAPAEKFIHKECGAGHVAGVLQQRDEEKENQNLRKKNQNAADSGNDAVAHQALQRRVGGENRTNELLRGRGSRIDQIHERPSPGVEALKDHIHHTEKNQCSPHAVEQEGVDGVMRAGDWSAGMDHAVEQGFQMAVMDHRLGGTGIQAGLADFFVCGIQQLLHAGFVTHAAGKDAVAVEKDAQRLGLCEVAASSPLKTRTEQSATVGDAVWPVNFGKSGRGIERGDDGPLQLLEPIAACGDGFHDRDAEPLGKQVHIDTNAISFRGVALVQGDQRRDTQLRALRDKKQVALEVCGIEHKDQQVRLLQSPTPSEHIHHHPLVVRDGCETVASRQVEKIHFDAANAQEAGFFLHRDAWIICDMLAQAGEAVEKCGLSRVGISHERDKWTARPLFRRCFGWGVHSAMFFT